MGQQNVEIFDDQSKNMLLNKAFAFKQKWKNDKKPDSGPKDK